MNEDICPTVRTLLEQGRLSIPTLRTHVRTCPICLAILADLLASPPDGQPPRWPSHPSDRKEDPPMWTCVYAPDVTVDPAIQRLWDDIISVARTHLPDLQVASLAESDGQALILSAVSQRLVIGLSIPQGMWEWRRDASDHSCTERR